MYESTRFCVPRLEASSKSLALPSSSGDAGPSGESPPYRRAVRKMAGINRSETPAIFVLVRTDPNEQESMVLQPELEGKVP